MEIVIALIMYLNNEMVEHTYKESLSKCLKSKRIAIREVNPQSVLETMEDLKPEEYKGLMEDATMQAEEENMLLEEIKQDPVIGSFLSMGEQ